MSLETMPKSARCAKRCQYAVDVGLAGDGLFPGGSGWGEGYSCHHECQYIDDDLNEVDPWSLRFVDSEVNNAD